MNSKLDKIQKEIDELKDIHENQMQKIKIKEQQLYQVVKK